MPPLSKGGATAVAEGFVLHVDYLGDDNLERKHNKLLTANAQELRKDMTKLKVL